MRLTLTQSRFQNIFNRFYLNLHYYFWVIVPTLVFSVLLEKEINWLSIQTMLLLGVVFIFCVSIWLVVFNRGENAVIEYKLEVDDDGLTYIRYGSKLQIKWCDFEALQIKNMWPRMISLKSKRGKAIEFCYYTFSSEQRRKLFEVLSKT